jgi:hypothetical protein
MEFLLSKSSIAYSLAGSSTTGGQTTVVVVLVVSTVEVEVEGHGDGADIYH